MAIMAVILCYFTESVALWANYVKQHGQKNLQYVICGDIQRDYLEQVH